jgi:ABC-2 type transport system permease protein
MKKENIVASTKSRKRSLKYQALLELIVALALLVVVNIIASRVFTRIDFTKEKRYSLSQASKDLAKKLDDVLYVKVHLDGELNPDFKRLRTATKEMLDEFRVASGGKIEYEFADPLADKTPKEKAEIIKQLQESGLEPTEIFDNTDDQSTRRVIVPGATFYYKTSQYYTLNLLKQQFGQPAQVVLNKSIEALEYEIASTLRKVAAGSRKRIAYLEGHGELGPNQTADLNAELGNSYTIERFNMWMDSANADFINQFAGGFDKISEEDAVSWLLDTLEKRLNSYDLLIVAKPTEYFSNQEKYHIDQYLMNGGKIIWLIDPLIASLDTINEYQKRRSPVMTADYDLNLNDMLFQYGVRVNPDLIQDAECNQLMLGGKLYPWVYNPIVVAKSSHPIVKNLNPLLMQFASSIDTVGSNKGVSKKILLTSSLYSRPVNNPVELSFDIVANPPAPQLLNKPERPLAVLLEGTFESSLKGQRRVDADPNLKFKEQSPKTAMIVIGDGDLISNTISGRGEIFPLGFDRNTKRMFDNKKFMVNCVDYLLDESGLIEVRTKEFEIRPLNKTKVKKEENYWKTLNMVLPVVGVIIFGLINGFIRRRKYVR